MKTTKLFLLGIALFLFLPTPYFYHLTSCTTMIGGACFTSLETGVFYGAHFIYETWMNHQQPWNYFENYQMSISYLLLWLLINLLILGVVSRYLRHKKLNTYH